MGVGEEGGRGWFCPQELLIEVCSRTSSIISNDGLLRNQYQMMVKVPPRVIIGMRVIGMGMSFGSIEGLIRSSGMVV